MFFRNKLHSLKNWFSNKVSLLLSEYKIAREKLKDLASTNTELGIYHLYRGNYRDAAFRFRMVLSMKPQDAMAHFNMARLLLAEGKEKEATAKNEQALNYDPELIEAKYLQALINKNYNFLQIPNSLIKEFFSYNANDYNNLCKENNYQAPVIAYNLVASYINNTSVILDLGCGTGLLAKVILENEQQFKSLTGVDCSIDMLEFAKKITFANKICIYDKLINNDANEFLDNLKVDNFDIIFAVLLFSFVNDFASLLKKCYNSLNKEGYMVIAVEKSLTDDVRLNEDFNGYCYSENYIRSQFTDVGFKELDIICEPISDKVPGIFVVAKKS